MKQTNNAIKFLMAQYRAIFQNAYFKGLATAAVVTMGLAAGQAQAANDFDGLAGTEELVFDSTANAVALEESGDKSWTAPVIVTAQGKDTKNHSIKAKGGDLNLTGDTGSLTVETGDATKGISLEAVSAGALTVDIASINVTSGLLKVVSDASKAATIKANTITLGQSSAEPALLSGEPTAVLDLGTKSVLGKVDANGGSTINIFNGAALKIQDSNAAIADVVVNAKDLTISGGSILLGEGTKNAAAEIKISEGSMTGGSITIAKSGTATISAQKPTGSEAPVSFDVTGGNLEVSGTLKVGQDVAMSVTGDAKLYTKTTEAQAGVDITSGGVFKTSKEALLGLTTGKNSAGEDYVTGAVAYKGGVNIAKGGVLYITGDNVSLKGLTFASGGALTAKSITSTDTAGDSTLKFDSLVVDAKVANSDKFDVDVLGTLTLGAGEYTGGASNKSFNQINAKSLAFNSNEAYDLAEKVVLASADNEGKAASGSISGNAKLSETLELTQGEYKQEGTLTFAAASQQLNIKAAKTVDKTSLDFNGTLELDRTKASTKISVSGDATASDSGVASLDLTDATINFVDNNTATNAVTIEAADNATVSVTDEQLKNIFFADGTTNGVVFDVNKGKLLIDGNVELTASQIANNTSTSGIKLQSGSVVVDGELVLRKADEISLGNGTAANATLKAASLDAFKNAPASTSTSFKSGTFTFTQGLNTDAADGFIIDSGSVMKLGDFVALDKEQTKWKSESETGSITKDLVLKADGVKLDIVAGDWDAQKVTVTSGTLTVGNDGTKNDANGEAIKSSLTISNLIASSTTPIEITKQGTLKTTEITVNDGASINVSGDMYIAGKHADAVTGDEPKDEQFGIKLADNAISLKAGSTLTLGEQANYALGLADASGKVDAVTVNNTVFNAAGSLSGDAFSTVKLSLADGVELTAKALKELKAGLFGQDSTVSTIDIGAAKISGLDIKTDAEGNKTLDWSAVDTDVKNVLPTYKDAELAQTTILIDSGENVFGHVGAVKANGVSKNGSVTVSNHGSLNSADNVGGKNLFAYNEKNEAVGLSVSKDVNFALVNGGEAGKVSLAAGSALLVDGGAANGKTVLAALDGDATSKLTVAGDLNVTGDANLGKATSKEGTSFTVGGNAKIADVAVLDGSTSVKGNLSTKNFTSTGSLQVSGTSTFDGETKLAGNNTLLGDVAFNAKTTLEGQNTLGATTFKESSSVAQGQTFAKEIKLSANTVELSVGHDAVENTLPNGSTANLVADKLTLAGGTLYADPTFNLPRTIVVAGELTQLDPADKDTDAGTLDGKAVALRNSIIALGVDTKDADGKDAYQASVDYVKNTFAPLFEADQSLQSDGIGAIAYVNKKLTMGTNSKIVVDPTNGIDGYKKAYADTTNTAYKTKIDGNEIYLGTGAALAVDANALNNGAAISFDKATNASVYAEENAKVLVVGKGIQNKSLVLFENTNTNPDAGVILNGKDLAVESINGLFKGKFTVGQSMEGEVELSLDRVAANKYLSSVSAPVQDTLLAAAYGMHNYEEYEAAKKDGTLAKFQDDSVLGDVAEGFKVVNNKGTYEVYYGDQVATAEQLKEFNIDKDTSIELAQKNPDVKEHVVYANTKNDLLDNILYYDGNAIDAETNARLAVFGGAPQAAIEAGASTYEAISARMGVGVSGVSAAANGQGGAIWVTPVYKSADADGFAADNKSYGADVKLYGLALGADIEVAPNFKVGGMFNVGSGDADGQGLGSNVSNDFDYYGLGLYAGYSMDAFSLVADVTYTAVDNDIEGNIDLGKVNASIDSTNLSVGVTGQYKLSLAGMDVTPHAGLRYSMIDMDDYSTAYSQNDSDSINIFSLPVGVTIAKEYVTDTWTVKPSFDLTLTGNFGDDEVDTTAKWNGFSNLSTTVKSEIMDNFTYGAAVGVSATSGNFGLGLGLNYTGSSNTDEFGVNANARYMF